MPDHPAGIPALRVRTLESYVERLEAIRRDAESAELKMLEYLISMAKHEAEMQVRQGAREREARAARLEDLWRPVKR